jgi:adenylate cyclase
MGTDLHVTSNGTDRAIAFADLAGYTALTEVHGDVGAADVAQRFFELARSVLVGDARIVKTIGDAVMIVAAEPEHGLRIGLDLLRAVEREPDFPGIRVGVHHGAIVERGGDVFGATVNVAARLTAHAGVGQLLTTAAIATRVEHHPQLTTTTLGAVWLKNVSDPVEVYAVADHTSEASSQVLDPVCRMFVDADRAPARLPWGGRGWLFCSFECASRFSQDPERFSAHAEP